ncbi:flagellar hook-length control protein FliK [Marinimicrobium sp. ARAG 43.8]|uniref:flagellar hook-length control protein FliK n=1 Tax=Marinimicrobium sp. ARAG 43.8 TaxID=3418719 RepID=UPI003CE67897
MVEKLSPITALAPLLRPTAGGERPAAPEGLMNLLGLSANRSSPSPIQVFGEVQHSAPASVEQRSQLLDRLLAALAQSRELPASPQRDQQLTRLANEQRLLNSPLLQLVRVRIEGVRQDAKAPQPSLVVYTDQPVKTGQRLALVLNEGRLNLATPSGTDSAREQALSQATQALRRSLPLRDGPDLATALSQLDTLPATVQRQLLGTSLQEALRSAAQQLRQPSQLTQPGALQKALAENGVQLEQRLLQALRTTTQEGRKPLAGDNARPSSVATVLANDWKAALLSVLARTRAELSRLGAPAEFNRATPPDLGPLLTALMTQSNTSTSAEPQTLRTQLLQLVQQLTLHSLARVQVQQQQSLAQSWAPADPAQQLTPQPWILELPVRWGQDIQTLSLRIEEEENQGDNDSSGGIRQWQVQLGFELPGVGAFHALITVRDPQVATRLWVERPDVAATVRNRLDELQQKLEREGINVTRLECHVGQPPTAGSRIHYSLVDIRT